MVSFTQCPQCLIFVDFDSAVSASKPKCSKCNLILPKKQVKFLQSGKFTVIKTLAQGAMGAIILAEHNLLKHRCVLKMVLLTGNSDEDKYLVNHLIDEAQLLIKLRHPGLPQVWDLFYEGGRYFLVMEFIEGENLEQFITREFSTLKQTWELETTILSLMIELINITMYLHEEGIIHRDIKPANIILAKKTEEIILVDFGIAKIVSGKGIYKGTAIGSKYYTPPEAYGGEFSTLSDAFSVGATMFHLLTGRHLVELNLLNPYNYNARPYCFISDWTVELIQELTTFKSDQRRDLRSAIAMMGFLLSKLSDTDGKPIRKCSCSKRRRNTQKIQIFQNWYCICPKCNSVYLD